MSILIFLGLIAITALFEYSWIYTANEKSPIKASLASAIAVILSAIEVIMYIDDHYRIIAVCIGAFIGTYIIKYWDIKK